MLLEQGELDEHEKLVLVIQQVDVVISALAYPQVLDQLKIIDAIKVAGTSKVFIDPALHFRSLIQILACFEIIAQNQLLRLTINYCFYF